MGNASPALDALVQSIRSRALPEGGFSLTGNNDFRVDATAWAITALCGAAQEDPLLPAARKRLAASQMADGAVPVMAEAPDAVWPTPLSIFAWLGVPAFEANTRSATEFLLKTVGKHFPRPENSPSSHDSNLKGWPWTLKSSPWVEPTALAVLALGSAGYADHPRAVEGRRLLLDRQLPSGGWNYGNVMVYGQVLLPNPECTGLALAALAGACFVDEVAASLAWLQGQVQALDTPMSLSWSLLGLSAWDRSPAMAGDLIARCLDLQERWGPYETWHLALLLLSGLAGHGLAKLLAARGGEARNG